MVVVVRLPGVVVAVRDQELVAAVRGRAGQVEGGDAALSVVSRRR